MLLEISYASTYWARLFNQQYTTKSRSTRDSNSDVWAKVKTMENKFKQKSVECVQIANFMKIILKKC